MVVVTPGQGADYRLDQLGTPGVLRFLMFSIPGCPPCEDVWSQVAETSRDGLQGVRINLALQPPPTGGPFFALGLDRGELPSCAAVGPYGVMLHAPAQGPKECEKLLALVANGKSTVVLSATPQTWPDSPESAHWYYGWPNAAAPPVEPNAAAPPVDP
jgi:hypothetical protein